MAEGKPLLPLDYTPDWITLGIVTYADIDREQLEHATGGDPHPEHYRWRAFSRFLGAQQSITPSLARQLYRLGANDADYSMGGSIMAEILHHRDCPSDLVRAAMTSERQHLRQIAAELPS